METRPATREEAVRRNLARDVFPWLVALVFAALAILAGVLWLNQRSALDKTDHIPEVKGMQRVAAEEQLRAAGFDVKVNLETNNSPEGVVLEQAPEAGSRLTKDARVYIAVSRGPAVVVVPKVTGIRANAARRLLTAVRLEPVVRTVPSTQPKDLVLSQTPLPGDKVGRQTIVTIEVSEGPNLVAVPALRNLSKERARALLEKAGLVAVFRNVPSPVSPGTVIAQNPPRGREVRAGTRVLVNVAAGTGLVTVPSVTGMAVGRATEAIADAGLAPIVVNVDSSEPEGTVIAQDPPADEQVNRGTRVEISVSRGPPGETTTP